MPGIGIGIGRFANRKTAKPAEGSAIAVPDTITLKNNSANPNPNSNPSKEKNGWADCDAADEGFADEGFGHNDSLDCDNDFDNSNTFFGDKGTLATNDNDFMDTSTSFDNASFGGREGECMEFGDVSLEPTGTGTGVSASSASGSGSAEFKSPFGFSRFANKNKNKTLVNNANTNATKDKDISDERKTPIHRARAAVTPNHGENKESSFPACASKSNPPPVLRAMDLGAASASPRGLPNGREKSRRISFEGSSVPERSLFQPRVEARQEPQDKNKNKPNHQQPLQQPQQQQQQQQQESRPPFGGAGRETNPGAIGAAMKAKGNATSLPQQQEKKGSQHLQRERFAEKMNPNLQQERFAKNMNPDLQREQFAQKQGSQHLQREQFANVTGNHGMRKKNYSVTSVTPKSSVVADGRRDNANDSLPSSRSSILSDRVKNNINARANQTVAVTPTPTTTAAVTQSQKPTTTFQKPIDRGNGADVGNGKVNRRVNVNGDPDSDESNRARFQATIRETEDLQERIEIDLLRMSSEFSEHYALLLRDLDVAVDLIDRLEDIEKLADKTIARFQHSARENREDSAVEMVELGSGSGQSESIP